MKLLKKLSEACGIPGHEDEIREIVKSELKNVADEIKTDVMGNVIAFKKGSGKKPLKVMLSAHMDEIGFIVKHINDKGFINLEPYGGLNPQTLMAQRVTIHGRKKKFKGVIGVKSFHTMSAEEKKKTPELKDLFVDVGYTKKELKNDIEIGDMVTLQQEFVDHGNLVSGKCFDNRTGVYVMIEAMKKLKQHSCDIYAVASAQEEVGLRGAMTSAFHIAPDIGIALDTTIAGDIPGGNEAEQVTSLGEGTAIKIKDSSCISNPKLVQFTRDLAKKHKIKHQMEILSGGGTDSGAIQKSRDGVMTVTLSIPTRYIHSVVETENKKDIQATIDLLAKLLENIDKIKVD